jgi:hypothetical protein
MQFEYFSVILERCIENHFEISGWKFNFPCTLFVFLFHNSCHNFYCHMFTGFYGVYLSFQFFFFFFLQWKIYFVVELFCLTNSESSILKCSHECSLQLLNKCYLILTVFLYNFGRCACIKCILLFIHHFRVFFFLEFKNTFYK